MITIDIVGVKKGRLRSPDLREWVASVVLQISDGTKTKTVDLHLHDTPDKSAAYSDDEESIIRAGRAALDDPAWRKRIEGWL